MKYTLFTVLATAFTSFANAYTTPVGDPQGNPIYKPGLNEIVPVGSPYTITWTPTTSGTVTLVLLRGPSTNVLPLYAIVEKIDNTGTYSWTPSSDLEADVSHYGIQLIDDTTGQYQYTTQFGISNSAPVPPSPSPSPPPPPSSYSSPPPPPSLYSASPSSSYKPSVPPTYSMPTSSCTSASVAAPSGGYPHGGLVTSGTVVYSTSMVTVTSCGPAVTNCPGKTQTPTALLPKPSVWTSAWNSTVSKYVSPTGYAPAVPSANVTKPSVSVPVVPVSPGAGDKIRVGGAMVVVMVAGLALIL